MSNLENFASAVLQGIGAPVTPQNVSAFIGWSQAEGPIGGDAWQRNNPLNTTQGAPGARTVNSAGVKGYPDFQTGVRATIQTLKNGAYGGIVNAFRSNNPHALAGAIGSSPWGTSGSLAAQTIAQNLGKWNAPSGTPVNVGPRGGVSTQGSRPVTFNVPGMTKQVIIPGGIDTAALATAALEKEASRPINPSGKFSAGNPLADYMNLERSGQFNLPDKTVTVTGQDASATIPGMPGSGGAGAGAGAGGGAVQHVLNAAHAALGGIYTQANHATAFYHPAGWSHANGTDCSGFVSMLMGPQGLGIWHQPYTTDTLPQAPGISRGPGHQITIWNNPAAGNAGHVWIQIGNQYFESAGGIGVHQMSNSEVAMYKATGKYTPWHPNGM